VQVKHRVVQGVHRPIEALNFINPEGRLKDQCCKECIGSETQITRGYLKIYRKECEKRSFWEVEFTSESSGRITPLEFSKGDGDEIVS
jgi:hypothetical protein